MIAMPWLFLFYGLLPLLAHAGLAGPSPDLPLTEYDPANLTSAWSTSADTDTSGPRVVQGKTISVGYVLPQHKQGLNDQRFFQWSHIDPAVNSSQAAARYEALLYLVAPSVRRYNLFWSAFETTNTVPCDAPLHCPAGTTQVPGSEAERLAKGYNRFHCYSTSLIRQVQAYLLLDHMYGIESAAIMWGMPDNKVAFRSPQCQGNSQVKHSACVPTAASMPDWADYCNFLAEYFSTPDKGRLTHFIVWNEVASPIWFDDSPDVNTSSVTATGVATWLDKYATMLHVAHDAIERHYSTPAMLYASIDQKWARPPCPPGEACHIGSQTVIQGLWDRLGTDIDWSLAVHPYGNATQHLWPHFFTFADLPQLAAWQTQLAELHNATEPHLAPQAMMAASEQGWNATSAAQALSAAGQICHAHAVAQDSMTNCIFVTHEDFQQPWDGDGVGLIPHEASWLLDGGNSTMYTYAAYAATHPLRWGVSEDHFCCQQAGVGCTEASV